MKRLMLCFLLVGAGILLNTSAVQPAPNGCSPRDRVDLLQAGYTKAEVRTLCDVDLTADLPKPMEILSGEGQARWIQWCVTPQGRCPLNPMLGYYPVDFPCNCYWPWGFYNGVAQ
jgi:hypothetical protein